MLMGWRTLSPANVVRGDVSGLHLIAGLEARMVRASVHGFVGALTPWRSAMGLFFLLFIVTDDLALPMTSSRPPCASGCGGGPQRHHCPTDGQELAFFNL